MCPGRATVADAMLSVENIGGISEASVGFSPGVTVLEGRNATNRTSLLQSIMAALGSDAVEMKADADEASLELELGEETYVRHFSRRDGAVVADGDPYLDDSALADLFAFLLESNETRRAVARDEDLRDLIMRPVDTEEIEREKNRLVEKRENLRDDLEAIDDLKGGLPDLEQERTRLEDRIEAKRTELEEIEARLEAIDRNVEETREERAALEETLSDLRAKRSRLDDIRFDLETERESLEQLEQERNELRAELTDLTGPSDGELADIESGLSELRARKQSIEAEINELQSVIGFNEELLSDVGSDVFAALDDGDQGVTDDLLPDDERTCWTCGSVVKRDQIAETIDQLRELSRSKLAAVNDLTEEIDDLTEQRRELEESHQERERAERRLAELEDDIDAAEDAIERLGDQREAVTDEIESLEQAVEELETEDGDELLELHREANRHEYELGSLESDLERVESEIRDVESRINDRSDVEARLETVAARIEDLKTKIDGIEREAVEEFNEHMDTVLDLLKYVNLDRIWIERVEREVREGRRTTTQTVFELHVVRATESGTVYEDTIDHLSESEREVTGLVFGLAGYLAHDLHEAVPFILLDSLEAIDAERIATLVDYLAGHADYLVVALLPEDAAALSEEYERVTDI